MSHQEDRRKNPMALRAKHPAAKTPKIEDGPLARHPDEIAAHEVPEVNFPLDVAMKEYSPFRKAKTKEHQESWPDDIEDIEIRQVIFMPSIIDMSKVCKKWDNEKIEAAVERLYINSELYLQPGMLAPLGMVRRYGQDWDLNAKGIYYRHHYSSHWVTDGRKLWVPSVQDLDWDNPSEEPRRARARTFVRHALDNEKWNKSEYAWEADAWSDVFGQMRNDPTIAADKQTYYFLEGSHHEVSRLAKDDAKSVWRVPDATFGLATFEAESHELQHDRLQALMLHPDCGLVSDPQLGDTNLAFPFAVYEAKGWSGDPRKARWQACTAGMVYLDILDALARRPDCDDYQKGDGRNSQVFALTSFGAHWHILVGYKRPRRTEEYAGTEGMSKEVYIFQRVWSGRVVTERKAWELLSLVDQIHLWGATQFRDRVISHLKAWHELADACYAGTVEFMMQELPEPCMDKATNKLNWKLPLLDLPEWTGLLKPDAQERLQSKLQGLLVEEYVKRCGVPPGIPPEKMLELAESLRNRKSNITTWREDLPGMGGGELGGRKEDGQELGVTEGDGQGDVLVEVSPQMLSDMLKAESPRMKRRRKA